MSRWLGKILAPQTGSPPPGTGYYAATTGSATGAGTIGDPWTLTVAFAGGFPANTVQPDDTVWIRGGTYTGSYSISRPGTFLHPITYRAYPGERATIDNNGGAGTEGEILSVAADYVRVQDLEITDSNWLDNSAPSGVGGAVTGAPYTGVEIINNVIHDTGGTAISAFSDPLDGLTAYGNIVYYPGGSTQGAPGKAYCVYTANKSTSPAKVYENNVFHFQWGVYALHAYTQGGELFHIQFKKNSVLVAGDLKGSGRNWNFFGSASVTLTDFLLDQNCIFGSAFADPSDQGLFDFGVDGSASPYDAVEDITVTNNLMGVGTMAMPLSGQRTNFVMTGNTMWGTAYVGWTYGVGGEFPTNTFHSSRPGANWTAIYPNTYETGRAMLVCFNWANAGSQNFDFSSFLSNGNTYEVRDAFDFYGTAIASGTYTSGNVSIPLSATPPIATASKIPSGYSQPQHPAPDYYCFIVRKT